MYNPFITDEREKNNVLLGDLRKESEQRADANIEDNTRGRIKQLEIQLRLLLLSFRLNPL